VRLLKLLFIREIDAIETFREIQLIPKTCFSSNFYSHGSRCNFLPFHIYFFKFCGTLEEVKVRLKTFVPNFDIDVKAYIDNIVNFEVISHRLHGVCIL